MTLPRAPWAIYVRAAAGDGGGMMRDLVALGGLVGRRDGRIAGVYGEYAGAAGEFGVLLGHAHNGRFNRLAVITPAHLGDTPPRVEYVVTCMIDLGVRLYALHYAGYVSRAGYELGPDAARLEAERHYRGCIAST